MTCPTWGGKNFDIVFATSAMAENGDRKQVVREAVCSGTMPRKERRVLQSENLQDEEVWND
jgi:hypothetical protein